MRKVLYQFLRIIGLIAFLTGIFLLNYWIVERIYRTVINDKAVEPLVDVADRDIYKVAPFPDMGHHYVVDEKKLKNLNMIGRVNRHGVYGANKKEQLVGITIRTLRYKNITRKVEKKYGLEENIILAMIAQETGGAQLVPNAVDDGGLGLCHMQPYTASAFGLKIYDDCQKIRSRAHGKKLRKLIKMHNADLKKLIQYDDRFHPIKNLDAAGRMLAYFKLGKQLEDTPLQTSIRWYAGKYNSNHYYKKIMYFKEKFNSRAYIDTVRQRFNAINEDFSIGGEPADFDMYLDYFQSLNRNYGLDEYH